MPRIIHTMTRITALTGLNLLIVQKLISKPSGNENSSVKKNIRQVYLNPSKRYTSTSAKFIIQTGREIALLIVNDVVFYESAFEIVFLRDFQELSVGEEFLESLVDIVAKFVTLLERYSILFFGGID